MKNGDETLWTIEELGERVAEALGWPGLRWRAQRAGARRAGPADDPLLHDARLARPAGGDARADGLVWAAALAPARGDQAVAGARVEPGGRARAGRRALRRSVAAARRGGGRGSEGSHARSIRGFATREESFWRVQPEAQQKSRRRKSPGVQDVPLEAGLVLSLTAGRTLERRRPPRDPHGGGTVDRNTQAARADRRRPHHNQERRRAMTTTRSKPLPLLDEAASSLVADCRPSTTPASAPSRRLVAACR